MFRFLFWHYKHFLNNIFCNFQPPECNDSPDFIQKSIDFSHNEIISVEGNIVLNFWYVRKGKAVNKTKNASLVRENGLFKILKIFIFSLLF